MMFVVLAGAMALGTAVARLDVAVSRAAASTKIPMEPKWASRLKE